MTIWLLGPSVRGRWPQVQDRRKATALDLCESGGPASTKHEETSPRPGCKATAVGSTPTAAGTGRFDPLKLTDREKAVLQLAHRMKPLTLSDVRGCLRALRGGCFYADCNVKAPHDH